MPQKSITFDGVGMLKYVLVGVILPQHTGDHKYIYSIIILTIHKYPYT